MTDETTADGVRPPKIDETFKAAWAAFKTNAKVIVPAFAIFFGANLLLSVLLMLIAGSLGILLQMLLSVLSLLPSVLLLPGLYSIALKSVRGRKPEITDLVLMFKDGRFIHHVGLLLLQICGALVCFVGVFVTQALFIPGSFWILDRKMDWDGAMQLCIETVKPQLGPWILFNVVVVLAGFAGTFACFVGVLITGPIALCAWAYAYDKTLAGIGK